MTGLLIFIGLILVILNVIAIKKQGKSFDGMLGNAMGNINEYDIKLGEIRREFSESIVELQSELMVIREIVDNNYIKLKITEKINDEKNKVILHDNDNNNDDDKNKIAIDDNDDDNNNKTSTGVITDTSTNSYNGNDYKVKEIKRLFSEGLSAEEISESLQLGKGEVLLIKDLYIR